MVTLIDSEAHFEYMFQGIGDLLPRSHQVFVALSHLEVQVLILLAGDQAVVIDPLFVVRDRPPSVSVKSLQERETCTI